MVAGGRDAGGESGVPPEHERKLRTSLLTVGELSVAALKSNKTT